MASTSKTDVWMPLYVADYLADTGRLTTEQHGAYLLILMDYWRNGAPLDDDIELAQITRMSIDAWSIARAKLERFFIITEGCWVHARVEKELADAKDNRNKAKAKAEKAAAARWGDKNNSPSIASGNAPSTHQEVSKQCPSPSPSPTPSTNVEGGAKKRKTKTSLPEVFEPTDSHRDFAGLNNLILSVELEKFRLHHEAQLTTSGNWNSSFSTWLYNAVKFSKRDAPKPDRSSKHQATLDELTGRTGHGSASALG